tara:strand:+ start:24 stop:293 length:270 start_codon:yes stop_codon:yes gene_type:complete
MAKLNAVPGKDPKEKHAKIIADTDFGNKLNIINLQIILLTIRDVDDRKAKDLMFKVSPFFKLFKLNFTFSTVIPKIKKDKMKIIYTINI